MPSILREISEWSTTLPYWEQAALEKIVSGVTFTDGIYDELLLYLLEDVGLETQNGARPELSFPTAANSDEDTEKHNSVRLKKISNLKNINALVPDQILEFGDQLTVIFGSNGSGKSGYARVLASASFTRGDKEILRDISKPVDETDSLSADLVILREGQPTRIHHEIGQVCPEMHSFYVFDSTSVRAHLTRSNPMSFSPAGLEYLTRLAEVTDTVRKRLQQRIDNKSCDNPFTLRFVGGETAVTQIVNQLGPLTDLALVQQLGTMSTEETQRIVILDREIAQLKSADIPAQINEINEVISDLNLLVVNVNGLEVMLNDQQFAFVSEIINSWQTASRAAQAMGVEQFNNPWFKQTGSKAWFVFIDAAYQLSQAEERDDVPYPSTDSHCLLCQQPLDSKAQDLLNRLWAFLVSDAQERIEQANQNLEGISEQLQNLEFDLLDDQAVSYRHLQTQDPQILEQTRLYIEGLKKRSDILINSIQSHHISELIPLPDNSVGNVNQIIGRLSEQRDELACREIEAEILHLTQEKLELEHRKSLAEVIDGVSEYVENTRWIERASLPQVKRSTAHISIKYNDLFDRLVTQEYIRLFQDTLVKLNCPLQVRINTRAKKGETIKQIVLQTDESILPDQAPPEKILSEGEQRAVALADFFTEVRLDKQSCGVVLDDPVTSLDFQWKDTIAGYIIEEATRQQVIVFTHDLHFLSLLLEKAGETIDIATHQIKKIDDTPGWVFTNSGPIYETEYKNTDRARVYLRKAMDVSRTSAEEEQMYLAIGFGQLRTTYEVFIQYELFQKVVLRFQERISGDRLKGVYIDEGIRDEVVESMGRLSRYIDAHSHSDIFLAQKPTVKLLEEEIKYFEDLVSRHSQIKKGRQPAKQKR